MIWWSPNRQIKTSIRQHPMFRQPVPPLKKVVGASFRLATTCGDTNRIVWSKSLSGKMKTTNCFQLRPPKKHAEPGGTSSTFPPKMGKVSCEFHYPEQLATKRSRNIDEVK